MHSASLRSFTVVTLVTLVFAWFQQGTSWVSRMVGRTKVDTTQECVPDRPCPGHRTLVKKAYLPQHQVRRGLAAIEPVP